MSEFVEVKTADLKGAALDWAVAIAEGAKTDRPQDGQVSFDGRHALCGTIRLEHGFQVRHYSPSTDWSHGGMLIDKHRVSIIYSDEVCDPCAWTEDTDVWRGETPLIAACRAIVAANLGDTAMIPKELCHD